MPCNAVSRVEVARDPPARYVVRKPVIRELIDTISSAALLHPRKETTEAADWEITVTDLKAKLDRGSAHHHRRARSARMADLQFRIVRLEAHPTRSVRGARMYELNNEDDIIVHCKMGAAALMPTGCFNRLEFKQVKNLKAGYGLGRQVDNTVPKY